MEPIYIYKVTKSCSGEMSPIFLTFPSNVLPQYRGSYQLCQKLGSLSQISETGKS